MTLRKGLGRGLDALLMGSRVQKEAMIQSQPGARSGSDTKPGSKFKEISDTQLPKEIKQLELPLEQLQAGQYQPRRDFSESALAQLADSIRTQGIIQPLIVRPMKGKNKEESYEIVAGERRYRAAKQVGLTTVPVVIKHVSNQTAMAMAVIENIQRQDLNPLEEANALERLSKEFGLTHAEVADAVGKSRATVSNSLRLLNLTTEVKDLLERGAIEVGHAKVLLGLRGKEQINAAERIVEKGWSVRETEHWLASLSHRSQHEPAASSPTKSKPNSDPDIRRLQNSLADKFGARVDIAHTASGGGKIIIHYNSLDEMDGILEHIH